MLSFSIITPSLNQGQFIERTIRSVLEQGYGSIEYVIQDGGSTDDTLTTLGRFAHKLTAVSGPDRGQADAVNRGMSATAGEIIGWLNSDDVYRPGALQAVADVFRVRPELDVLYGDAQLIDASDAILGSYYTEAWDRARLHKRCFLCQPAVFFRRRVVERFGPLDERLQYCMDYEYWLRLASGGATFAYVPTLLAASRQHPAAKSLSARLAVHHEINAMLYARLGRVPDSWLINQAHTLVELSRPDGAYSVDVIVTALRLAWRWNRAISGQLLVSLLQPVALGARRRLGLVPARSR